MATAGEGEASVGLQDSEAIARTVDRLAQDAAIHGSLIGEGAGTRKRFLEGSESPSSGGGPSPVKRPRGRPRKHPLPEKPSPKRPRGRPRKNILPEPSPTVQVPVPLCLVPLDPQTSTISSIPVSLTSGTHSQIVPITAAHMQQVAAVHLLQAQQKAGLSTSSSVPNLTVGGHSSAVSSPSNPPLLLTLREAETPGEPLGKLLVAEPAFQLNPTGESLAVVIQQQQLSSSGGTSRDEMKMSTQLVDIQEKLGDGGKMAAHTAATSLGTVFPSKVS